jgi:diketogulonate reductase-like aldo/keto reductase
MQTRPIPKTKEPLPVIGLGTWQSFDVGATPSMREPLRKVLTAFHQAGCSVIDSSPMYGAAESVVGDLLAETSLENKMFLATKVWTSGRTEGETQMTRSMQRMKTKCMDLMQVHNLVDWRTHLQTLRSWKEQGRVRYIGVTHYALSAFSELENILQREEIDFIQVPYSVVNREAEKRLLPLAQEKGVAVLIMRPFEEGALFRKTKNKQLPSWAEEFDCKSWAQVFLKWILGHPAVNCPIPASSKPEHLADNIQAGSGRLPTQEHRQKLVQLIG